VIIVLAVLLAVGALVVWRLGRRSAPGHATPAGCVEAYAEACKEGDVAGYLRCLGGPLHAEGQRQAASPGKLAEQLRHSMTDVKSWVQVGEVEVVGGSARVEADVVRPEGTRRVRFRLERSATGWLIAAVDAPQDVPTPIRFGTHVSTIPEGPSPEKPAP
jgi:hypothetical protein